MVYVKFQQGAVLNTQGFGNKAENVEVPFITNRAPKTSDNKYPIGKKWIYEGVQDYVLLSLTIDSTTSPPSLVANWAGESDIVDKDGTWVAKLNFGGSSIGVSQASFGTFQRRASLVFYSFRIDINGIAISSGSATITGLPYSPVAATLEFPVNILMSNVDLGSYTSLFAIPKASATPYLQLTSVGSNLPTIDTTNTAFASGGGSFINGAGYYTTIDPV